VSPTGGSNGIIALEITAQAVVESVLLFDVVSPLTLTARCWTATTSQDLEAA